MNKEYFEIFSDMMLNTYHDVLIYDVKLQNVYILKLGRKPELEGTFIEAAEAFAYLEENGVVQMAEKFLVRSFREDILERAANHESGFIFLNRTTINGEKRWVRVSMYVPDAFGSLDSKLVFCTSLLDDETALKQEIMMGVERNVFKIGKIFLHQNRMESIQLSYNEKASMKFYKGNTYSEEIEYVAQNMIHPDDREQYLEYLNPEKIKKYHLDGFSDYGFLCRRKSRKLYDWTYVKLLPTVDYKPEDMVFGLQIISISEEILKYVNSVTLLENEVKTSSWDSAYEHTKYVDRIVNALSAFTYSFETFLEIDLRNNHFVSFKSAPDINASLFPKEGNYPEWANKIANSMYTGDEVNKLLGFIKLENVRQRLVNDATIADYFRRKDGKLIKLVFAKTESEKGLPVFINVTSELVNENKNQLKVITFGNFEVLDDKGAPIFFEKKQSKQVLAYLIDKAGFPITNEDIITDVLEKPSGDLNARKYASALIRKAMRDLEAAGYPDVIIKESNQTRINKDAVDCDYYHLLDGNIYYWRLYHNEYMKEYSWAEETNSEIIHFFDK